MHFFVLANCFQILSPIIVLLFLHFLQHIVNHYVVPNIDNGELNSGMSGDDEGSESIGYDDGGDGIVRFIPCNIVLNSGTVGRRHHLKSYYFIFLDTAFYDPKFGFFLKDFFKEYEFIEKSPEKIDKAYENQDYWNAIDSYISRHTTLGGLRFKTLWDDPFSFKYSIQYEQRKRFDLGDLGGVVDDVLQLYGDGYNCGRFPSGVDDAVAMSDVAVNTFFYHQANFTVGTFISGLPYRKEEKQMIEINLTSILGVYFYPLILLLGFPGILITLVMEKESQLKEMMLMSGLRKRNYLFATFCFKYFWTLISLLFFYLLGMIYQHRMMVQTQFIIQLVVTLGISFHLVSIAFLFSSFIYSSFAAAIFSYFLVIFIPLVCTFTSFFLKGLKWKWLLMIPLYPVVEINFRMLTSCLNFVCLENSFAWKNQDFLIAVIMLYSTSLVAFVGSRYIEEVVSTNYTKSCSSGWGTRKNPFNLCFYFLPCCKNCCFGIQTKEEYRASSYKNPKMKKNKLRQITEEKIISDNIFDSNVDNFDENLSSPRRRYGKQTKEKLFDENNGVNHHGNKEDDLINKKREEVQIKRFPDEDEDVYEERLNILRGNKTRNNQVILVRGISKSFGGRHNFVVNNVHFGVKNKRCFGLLGPNGSGKTTLIRILSGLVGPSKGNAYIDGHCIRREMSTIRTNCLGVCPQFTVCWESLTPREHLLFYSRLKGVPFREERKHVDDILERVGLLSEASALPPSSTLATRVVDLLPLFFKKFMRDLVSFVSPYEKKSGQLSGGLRRRLALGIALTGNPNCVLLDEPSTGLDPQGRQKVWDVIENVKKERCVILTTHSMEEAEKCCDEIALMSLGGGRGGSGLICLGSPLHLKNRHGNGYTLTVKCKSGKSAEIALPVLEDRETFCGIYEPRMIRKFGQFLVFEIRKPPQGGKFRVSEIFETLESRKHELGILDYDLNQTTLEDVFLNVVGIDEERRRRRRLEEEIISPNHDYDLLISDDDDSSQQSELRAEEEIIEINLENRNNEEGKTTTSIINSIHDDYDDYMLLKENHEEEMEMDSSKNDNFRASSDDSEDNNNNPMFVPTNPSFIKKSFFKSVILDNLVQSFFLFRKNCVLMLLDWKTLCCLVISPFFIFLVLRVLIEVISIFANDGEEIFHPTYTKIQYDPPQKCNYHYPAYGDCVTYLFSHNGDKFAKDVIERIVFDNKLIEDEDFKIFQYSSSMESWIVENPNSTAAAVSFFNSTSRNFILRKTIGKNPGKKKKTHVKRLLQRGDSQFFYQIYYNVSESAGGDEFVLITKALVDNSIYKEYQIQNGIKPSVLPGTNVIDFDIRNIPHVKHDFEKGTGQSLKDYFQSLVMELVGPVIFSLLSCSLFIQAMYRIVLEKELGLKVYLEMIGMKPIPYFCSWNMNFCCYNIFLTTVIIIFGYVFLFDFFIYSNPIWIFLSFFSFQFALSSLALCLSSIVKSRKAAMLITFIFLAITFVLNLVLTNTQIVIQLFKLEFPSNIITILFELLYAPFNFGKFFMDVNKSVAVQFNKKTYKFDKRDYFYGFDSLFKEIDYKRENFYGFESLFKKNKYVDLFTYDSKSLQPPIYSILFLFVNMIIYLLCHFCIENLCLRNLHCEERFCWACSIRCCCFDFFTRKNKKKNILLTAEGIEKSTLGKTRSELSELSMDIVKEYEDTRDTKRQKKLRVLNMKKTYHSIWSRCFLKKPIRANKGLDFCIDDDQHQGRILCVLGPNGAGKSTAVSQIAGILRSDEGEVFITEFNRKYYGDFVKGVLGMTLQENVLWENLPSQDHIALIAQMKGYSSIPCVGWFCPTFDRRLWKEIQERLKEVSLLGERRKACGRFSGGMKRRLSLSMGFTANPELCVLDEPTTGLDPFSKRKVWEVIRQKNCSILLTTHSMEEADALSDKIVILKDGKIACVGDSLTLKKIYGEGIFLNFITKAEDEVFQKFMSQTFPHAKLKKKENRVLMMDNIIDGEDEEEEDEDEERRSNEWTYMYMIGNEFTDELIQGLKVVEEIMYSSEIFRAKKRDHYHRQLIIKDFGVSNTTFEDVYLSVVQREESKMLN